MPERPYDEELEQSTNKWMAWGIGIMLALRQINERFPQLSCFVEISLGSIKPPLAPQYPEVSFCIAHLFA